MEKEKEKGNDTFVIDMSSGSGARNRGGGFRSPSYTVLRKDIPAEKEERKPKAALPKFEKPEPLPKKKPPTPAPAPAPAPLLDQPVRLPPVQPIAPKVVVTPKPEPEPEPEPDIETPRLYLPLPERLRAWLAENAEEGESAAHIRSKYTYEWVRRTRARHARVARRARVAQRARSSLASRAPRVCARAGLCLRTHSRPQPDGAWRRTDSQNAIGEAANGFLPLHDFAR